MSAFGQDIQLPPPLPPRPKWPKVIGIISIVLGAMAAMSHVNSLLGLDDFSASFQSGFAANRRGNAPPMPPPTKDDLMKAVPADLQAWLIPGQILGLLDTLCLVGAGILLLKRKPRGGTLHVVYAVVAFPSAAFGLAWLWYIFAGIVQWMATHMPPPAPPPEFFSFMDTFMKAMVVMIGVFMLGYPTFILVWFCRPKVRKLMAQWATEGKP